MIQNIEVSKIFPHPENPRKDLGDLSELAASIKAKGILQNITVVPYAGDESGISDGKEMYRVIIGHRRLAAAKLAGLTEVPCAVSSMDHKEQVATMLLENMQRSDLTVYEQAQGFQTMINLGDSVKDITQKTGFSDTTVRNRMKLLELDQEKLKKSAERGGTLQDYLELDKIENIEMRNSVLDKIGTQNFNYELKQALDKEKAQKYVAHLTAELDKFAIKIEKAENMRCIKSYWASSKDKFTVPEDAGKEKYFYTVSEKYGYVYLYKEYVQTQAEAAEAESRRKAKEKKKALDDISKRAFNLRLDFVKNYTGAKKHMRDIIEYTVRAMLDDCSDIDYGMFADILNIKTNGEDEWEFKDIAGQFDKSPEYVFLVAVYCSIESESGRYYDWQGINCGNGQLNMAYDFLKKLGYEISDDEQALRNGTHKLFDNSVTA